MFCIFKNSRSNVVEFYIFYYLEDAYLNKQSKLHKMRGVNKMKNTLCRAKSVENKKWDEGYYAQIGGKDCILLSKSEKFFSIEDGQDSSGVRIVEVIPETLSKKIEDVKWYWKDKNFIENIEGVYLNDVVEFYHDGGKHIGYLDMEYGCLMIASATVCDGYVWVHDLEAEVIEDIDEYRYITAKLLGNRFDNKELLDKGDE